MGIGNGLRSKTLLKIKMLLKKTKNMNKRKSFLRKIPNLTAVLAHMNVFILLKSNI